MVHVHVHVRQTTTQENTHTIEGTHMCNPYRHDVTCCGIDHHFPCTHGPVHVYSVVSCPGQDLRARNCQVRLSQWVGVVLASGGEYWPHSLSLGLGKPQASPHSRAHMHATTAIGKNIHVDVTHHYALPSWEWVWFLLRGVQHLYMHVHDM